MHAAAWANWRTVRRIENGDMVRAVFIIFYTAGFSLSFFLSGYINSSAVLDLSKTAFIWQPDTLKSMSAQGNTVTGKK